MCKVCQYNSGEIKTLEGLKRLDCSYCPLLTTVPKIEGLKILCCYDCPLLTTIPNIEELKVLDCSFCPLLTTISEIEGLKILYCYDCPLLTNIPNIEGLEKLFCFGCKWLPNENKDYKNNINLLLKTQKMVKNFIKRRRLKYLEQEILKIYFHPDMKGGYFYKKGMMEFLTTLKE